VTSWALPSSKLANALHPHHTDYTYHFTTYKNKVVTQTQYFALTQHSRAGYGLQPLLLPLPLCLLLT
jgi:hypothetical protein